MIIGVDEFKMKFRDVLIVYYDDFVGLLINVYFWLCFLEFIVILNLFLLCGFVELFYKFW